MPKKMGSEGSTSPAAGGGGGACAMCGGAAALYCAADAAALCVPCDAAVHAANPLASRHERVPLAAAAAAAASGVYDDLFAADDVDAASSWPLPPAPVQGQGSPQGSSSASFTTSDSGADGRSLFDLLSDVDLAACVTGAGHLPDGGVAPVHHGSAPFLARPPGLAAWATTAWSPADAAAVIAVPGAGEREARVQRYREKRKNRKFQKTIRYASRKAYAEARPRIKGRFVKLAPPPHPTTTPRRTPTTRPSSGSPSPMTPATTTASGFTLTQRVTESCRVSRMFQTPLATKKSVEGREGTCGQGVFAQLRTSQEGARQVGIGAKCSLFVSSCSVYSW